MKGFFSLFVFTVFAARALAAQEIITAPVSRIFVPKGYDNNDNIELLVRGTLPDSCHARNRYEVEVQGEAITISITATRTPDGPCQKIDIPYLENVTVGSLQAGTYQVRVNDVLQAKLTGSEAASTSLDDHLYGMIQYVDLGFTGGTNGQFFLVGTAPACLALDRIETISNGTDTLSVLPIMKKNTQNCGGARRSINLAVNSDISGLDSKEVLLFVRTMDGKSVHALIER